MMEIYKLVVQWISGSLNKHHFFPPAKLPFFAYTLGIGYEFEMSILRLTLSNRLELLSFIVLRSSFATTEWNRIWWKYWFSISRTGNDGWMRIGKVDRQLDNHFDCIYFKFNHRRISACHTNAVESKCCYRIAFTSLCTIQCYTVMIEFFSSIRIIHIILFMLEFKMIRGGCQGVQEKYTALLLWWSVFQMKIIAYGTSNDFKCIAFNLDSKPQTLYIVHQCT